MVVAVTELKTHVPLQARVGIATGLVVVGDQFGSGASGEQSILGETPNLAARLLGIAEPGSVVIAESTRKLVGNLFELHDLGAQELKGIVGPARAWAALRPFRAWRWTRRPAWTIMSQRPLRATIMDLGGWLRSLGLGKYEAAFRENE